MKGKMLLRKNMDSYDRDDCGERKLWDWEADTEGLAVKHAMCVMVETRADNVVYEGDFGGSTKPGSIPYRMAIAMRHYIPDYLDRVLEFYGIRSEMDQRFLRILYDRMHKMFYAWEPETGVERFRKSKEHPDVTRSPKYKKAEVVRLSNKLSHTASRVDIKAYEKTLFEKQHKIASRILAERGKKAWYL